MYILTFLIIIILIVVVIKFNTFVMLRHKIKQSKSGIEVYLNKRFDLIPNLVECVKGYANYEERVISNIVALRAEYNNDNKKDLKKGAKLNNEFTNFMAVGENNPDLKADSQFMNLQKALQKMENELQAARRIYNGDVTLYNTTITTFPNNILASIFGFHQEELFQIEEYKKQNVKPNWR